MIAHLLPTASRCDCVLVLHGGRLREEGRADELAPRDGIFARLARIQLAATAA